MDFLIDLDNGEIYLGERNPRVTGASSMTNHAAFAHADAVYPKWSCLFASADEPPLKGRSGPDGLELLVLQFPDGPATLLGMS